MIRADDMGRKQNLRYSGRMGVGWSELKMFSLYSIIAASTASKHQTLASNGGGGCLRGPLSALSHSIVRKDGTPRGEWSSESDGSQLLPGRQFLGVF